MWVHWGVLPVNEDTILYIQRYVMDFKESFINMSTQVCFTGPV